ncbi:50S ribosomal protein L10 [Candidatus Berkiella aquae]|uniref:Large ribosomal subunit protein uL10 n=1 Tax=Candidatus Berkiella aquae TaxID=295108 RepID=A0A0Q9YMB7_9GAMM|nr:50S ribosomal protein L10 [Candidatus Berkiella aquae]MCS5710256.1 50S ribosomal protein L10 [Candidatus Berkiella aquae]
MALNLEDKKAIVAEVSNVANEAISLVVAEYRGLSVPAMTSLRKQARDNGIYLRVIRNTLARKALTGTNFECMSDALVGPLVFGFAKNEPGAAAKLFKEFAKTNDLFQVKALSVAGQYYDASKLDAVASLPTRLEALSQLAATLLAPATKLVRTIAEPHSGLVRALDDYRRKKEGE